MTPEEKTAKPRKRKTKETTSKEKTKPKTKPKVTDKPKTKSKAKPKAKAKPKTKPKAKAKPKRKIKTKAKARPKAKPKEKPVKPAPSKRRPHRVPLPEPMVGVLMNYRRGTVKQRHQYGLVQLEGVDTIGKASAYIGRTAVLHLNEDVSITGRVVAVHGRRGVLRVRFSRKLASEAIAKEVKVI